MLTKRTYFTRTYLVPALVASIAFPAAALAAHGGGASPRIGLADAKPVRVAALDRSAAAFDRWLHREAGRIRAEERIERRRASSARFASLPGGVSQSTLEAIAACESGGDPAAVSAGGTYRGLYQFDQGTWESVGGTGDPAAASPAEQTYRAALLYARSGSSPWPICG